MADFGAGNPEVDGGLGKVQEVTKEQVEQFQEQLRQAQAALAALQKEEGQAKKKDNALASLLLKFIKSNQDQDILQLIVACLDLMIPVNFIVAVLSLAYDDIYQEICLQLKKDPTLRITKSEEKFLSSVEGEEVKDLATKQQFDEHKLPDEVKKRVNEWVRDILLLSLENKAKTLETVYPEQKPHLTGLQLTTKILERYLVLVNIEGAFERIRAFAEFILKGIGRELGK